MGRTLYRILVEVLLCTVVAMGLVVSCLPRGTCCRCYPVFVSIVAVVFPGAEVDVVVATAVEALALMVCTLAGEGPLLLIAALLGLLFSAQSAAV
jgi:hypothetical protein